MLTRSVFVLTALIVAAPFAYAQSATEAKVEAEVAALQRNATMLNCIRTRSTIAFSISR